MTDHTVPTAPRPVRLARTPEYSVLLTAAADRAQLHTALSFLVPRCTRLGAEIVVAVPAPADDVDALIIAYPAVRFAAAADQISARELRSLGMREVTGDVVLIAEDRAVTEEWTSEFEERLISLRA